MKKAVIASGGKQYLVTEGEVIEVDRLNEQAKKLSFEPLLIFDEKMTSIGKPTAKDSKVDVEIVEADKAGEKVQSIRFEAKKRVHKVRGQKRRLTVIKILKIS